MKPEHKIVKGGIIAAGAGSRLRQDGWREPKPLIRVGGVPLIERVIRNFLAAGIESLVMIFNEDERDCERWVLSNFPNLDVQIIVKTTASSLESFREVSARLGSGRALISTVDVWCPEAEVASFLRTAQQHALDTTVLAVTSLVADESPLWVTIDGSGRVTDLGGRQGDAVTAGMYVVPERVRRLAVPNGLGRLRDYLTWLVRQREPMYAVHLGDIVDVDCAEDVALAEGMARRMNQAPVRSSGERT